MSKEQKYQKKELRQHIYDTPDTYAGGSDLITEILPVMDGNKVMTKEIQYIPVLYNMFNEILVNARDQRIRLQDSPDVPQVSHMKVNYDSETGEWSILNDGQGIAVTKHDTEKVYNAELIFGHLLTSSNYNKDEKKIVGGKNGYGAKVTNIFSKRFTVETVDHIQKKLYTQTFRENMTVIEPPKITKCSKKPYTKVTWLTDFERFGIQQFSPDMVSLMVRRVYDIAGVTDKQMSVFYNGEKLKIKSFQDYISLYPTESKKHYEKVSDRWEVAVCPSSNDKFEQVSFVNGIATPKGGIHVDVIVKQLTQGVVKYIKKKQKKDVPEKYVKNYLCVYINSVIENPSFDSQTKERLITPKSKFGSKPVLSEKYIKTVCDSGLTKKVLQFAEFKESNLVKKTDGKKKQKIRDIPKLDDANFAGTRKSQLCTLILTEGDSAKSMAIAGLSVVGRDTFGVFPLKGKMLNVRDASLKQIANNQEITNLKKIIGLESGKKYKDTKSLRYGKVMVMTDQDHDGSHIKGLFLNMIHSEWKELLDLGFVESMVTPIIKAVKGNTVKTFYTLTDYNQWKEKVNVKLWKIKYYKGLGTSTSKEAKEYFVDMKKSLYKVDDTTEEAMILAFKKTEADLRKQWLKTYNEEEILDFNQTETSIRDFIHLEFKHFSNSDNLRSIGNCIDGLKVSQRKVLYSCFKRNLRSEIRVAQLSGYVSEQACYHHGEASLQGTIVGMAQNFVGTNNVQLLQPNGQFGTRIMGGSDCASARYIHTQLDPITDKLFPKADFPLLDYINDDGILVEPKWYCPIVPMVLVNGMIGIGTGFSTSVPQFNPKDCVKNIKRKLNDKPYLAMKPYYQGFQGEIEKVDPKHFLTHGKYTIDDDKIHITELPIGMWTDNYKLFVESEIVKEDPWILDYENHSTDISVNFTIKVSDETIFDHQYKKGKSLEDKLKLTSKLSLTNLHLYTSQGAIRKYDTIYQIMDEHFNVRYNMYEQRKEYQLNVLSQEIKLLEAKMRFIQCVMDETIIVYKQTKQSIVDSLKANQFPFYENNVISDYNEKKKVSTEYNYLLNLSVYSFTVEKINELETQIKEKKSEYATLEATEIKDMWIQELDEFESQYKRSC